jgi:hypothetical protein
VTSGPFEDIDPQDFLLILSNDPLLIPCAAQPSSVFLFLSRANFLEAWQVWLRASLMHRGYPVSLFARFPYLPNPTYQADKWNPTRLYDGIWEIDYQSSSKFSLNPRSTSRPPLDPRLSKIILETQKIRRNNEELRKLSYQKVFNHNLVE